MATQEGSFNATLQSLEVGQDWWVETTAKQYANVQRQATSPRRPKGMTFTSAAFTAVSAAKLGETVILVRITRTG